VDNNVEGNGHKIVSDTPTCLVRRYEISIIPSSDVKPKKLREVKADGLLCKYKSIEIEFELFFFVLLDIGHLVKIKGLVTRASDVKPHVTVCTYTCESCGSELFQEVPF